MGPLDWADTATTCLEVSVVNVAAVVEDKNKIKMSRNAQKNTQKN